MKAKNLNSVTIRVTTLKAYCSAGTLRINVLHNGLWKDGNNIPPNKTGAQFVAAKIGGRRVIIVAFVEE